MATSGADAGHQQADDDGDDDRKGEQAARGTGRGAYSMRMRRSARVVSSRMIGGWMIGTRLMYEYAVTAIGASSSGASSEDT